MRKIKTYYFLCPGGRRMPCEIWNIPRWRGKYRSTDNTKLKMKEETLTEKNEEISEWKVQINTRKLNGYVSTITDVLFFNHKSMLTPLTVVVFAYRFIGDGMVAMSVWLACVIVLKDEFYNVIVHLTCSLVIKISVEN